MEIGGGTKKLKSKRHCRVLFNYLPNHDDELFLQVDDIIEIIAEVEEGWWQGRLKGKIGVFPSNFVTEIDYFAANAASTATAAILDDNKRTNDVSAAAAAAAVTADATITTTTTATVSPAATTAAAPDDNNLTKCTIPKSAGKTICIAKYLYNAKNADELTLREGDLITLLSTETQDKGWWLGEVNGKKGVFPDNFVMLANFDQNSQTFHHRKEFAKNAAAAAAAAAASTITTTTTTSSTSNNVAAQRESLQVTTASGANISSRIAFAKKNSTPTTTATTLDFALYESCDNRNGAVSHSDSNSRKVFNNELDDVERTILLSDPRASRAKPPKRRPPTSNVPDEISAPDTLVLDHNQNQNSFLSASEKSNQNENIYDAISETTANATTISLPAETNNSNNSMNRNSNNSSNASISNSCVTGAGAGVGAGVGVVLNQPVAESGSVPVAGSLTRNKIKEWEKHKVPWIDELKLNQKTKKIQPAPPPPLPSSSSSSAMSPSAVTASTVTNSSSFGSPPSVTDSNPSPSPSPSPNSNILPREISCSINITVPSYAAPPASFANTYHSGDVVTDSPQKTFAHHKEAVLSPLPSSTASAAPTITTKSTSKPIRVFPPFSNTTNTSSTSDKDNNNENCEDNSQMMLIERSKFESLVNRVSTLEALTTNSFHEFNIVIDEMKAKLEIEKDLRNLLQVQFEKLLHANKMKQI